MLSRRRQRRGLQSRTERIGRGETPVVLMVGDGWLRGCWESPLSEWWGRSLGGGGGGGVTPLWE